MTKKVEEIKQKKGHQSGSLKNLEEEEWKRAEKIIRETQKN